MDILLHHPQLVSLTSSSVSSDRALPLHAVLACHPQEGALLERLLASEAVNLDFEDVTRIRRADGRTLPEARRTPLHVACTAECGDGALVPGAPGPRRGLSSPMFELCIK